MTFVRRIVPPATMKTTASEAKSASVQSPTVELPPSPSLSTDGKKLSVDTSIHTADTNNNSAKQPSTTTQTSEQSTSTPATITQKKGLNSCAHKANDSKSTKQPSTTTQTFEQSTSIPASARKDNDSNSAKQSSTAQAPKQPITFTATTTASLSPEDMVRQCKKTLSTLVDARMKLQSEYITLVHREKVASDHPSVASVKENMRLLDVDINDTKFMLDKAIYLRDTTLDHKSSSIMNKAPEFVSSEKIPSFVEIEDAVPITADNKGKGSASVLDVFIRKFERAFLEEGVDITRHWKSHLYIAFEQSNYFEWFRYAINSEHVTSWEQCKTILRRRFDLSPQQPVTLILEQVVAFKRDYDESFLSCMDRFRKTLYTSKSNFADSALPACIFVNSLGSGRLRAIVLNILKKHAGFSDSVSNEDSLYHPENVEIQCYPSWLDFESILSPHFADLEKESLTRKRKATHQAHNKKTAPLSPAERQLRIQRKNNGQCMHCGVLGSREHYQECEARRQASENVNSDNTQDASTPAFESVLSD